MDFLDPRKTRSRNARLIIGYILVAIVIALGTVILVYGTDGFGINTKTGQIIQNGLLFVDSKPGGASIYLSGKLSGTTSSRLVLPAGNYDLKLTKDGYRDWERHFELDVSTISRFIYPFLFPQKPLVTAKKTYTSMPPLFTESPDHHWLLVQDPSQAGSISFDEYDTSAPTKSPVVLQLPTSLLTSSGSAGESFKLVEWSTDNNNVLLEHSYTGGYEFIVFNRADPSKSFNVNRVLNADPTRVALFNKKVSQLYIYQQNGGTLSVADMSQGTIAPPILRDVEDFKSYGTDIVEYVTRDNMPTNMAEARIWEQGKTYPLYTFTAGATYLLNTATYSGHDYYVAGSSADGRVNIYKDPISEIQNSPQGQAVPILFLHAAGADQVAFSDNARFIEIEGGPNFGVYDFETLERYEYTLKTPLAGALQWMDGHRLIGESDDQVFVMDYDSTNQQKLTPTVSAIGGYFSNDYNHLFTLAPAKGSSSITLNDVDMRAGADLPQSPQD